MKELCKEKVVYVSCDSNVIVELYMLNLMKMFEIVTTKFSEDFTKIVSPTAMGCFIPDKKRNAPLRTGQLSGRSQMIGQFSLYQCKGMSSTAALHIFCNMVSKLC